MIWHHDEVEFVRLETDDHDEDPNPWFDQDAAEARPAPSRKRGTASSILMAAMLGIVEALGWERPKDETVEVADAPKGDDGLILHSRHLEPLE
ncbi:MAG: hypothetical protein GY773_29545 [Actinomycetia bacterium]|nr:hypothetical protein [Actinomycetes bacterium]